VFRDALAAAPYWRYDVRTPHLGTQFLHMPREDFLHLVCVDVHVGSLLVVCTCRDGSINQYNTSAKFAHQIASQISRQSPPEASHHAHNKRGTRVVEQQLESSTEARQVRIFLVPDPLLDLPQRDRSLNYNVIVWVPGSVRANKTNARIKEIKAIEARTSVKYRTSTRRQIECYAVLRRRTCPAVVSP
jgi:hypothetical protein